MTREEIVTALRCCARFSGCNQCPADRIEDCVTQLQAAAADLIENQQRHIEALLQANAALRDTVLRRDAQIEKMSEGLAQFAKAVAVEEEQSELHAMKNELCQYCGKYKYAHEGACYGCKWRGM
jgi:hypothetical protein|nr:MAG TPA: hypothetical protein [Caudoviricetes sp.]